MSAFLCGSSSLKWVESKSAGSIGFIVAEAKVIDKAGLVELYSGSSIKSLEETGFLCSKFNVQGEIMNKSVSIRQRLMRGHRVTVNRFTLTDSSAKKIVVDLSVQDYKGAFYLVATRANGTVIKFRHYMITLEKCPETLFPLERILWQAVRAEFADEIAELENSLDSSWAQLDTPGPAIAQQPVGKLGSTEVDIVLPLAEPESGTFHSPSLEFCHLAAWDKTEALLHWPTAVGTVLVLRTKENENLYRLTLEQVPVDHPLHLPFSNEGRRVSVLVGLKGPVTSPLVDPTSLEQYFSACLQALSRNPGKQEVT